MNASSQSAARIQVFARTEVGCLRERNEDAFLVLNLETHDHSLQPQARIQELRPPGILIAVCDGMGGAAAGDVAAQMALDSLRHGVQNQAQVASVHDAEAALIQSVGEGNRAIGGYAAANPSKRGMGTTITGALAFGRELVIVQVGDSRAYLRRGDVLQQLTVDQSVVGQMVAAGQMTRDEARTSDSRNALLQALGVQERVAPDVVVASLCDGDQLLLCSDGLNTPLRDEAILELLLRHEDPMRCCRALTEAACAAGGPDNVTVAVARFFGGDLPPPQAQVQTTRRTVTI